MQFLEFIALIANPTPNQTPVFITGKHAINFGCVILHKNFKTYETDQFNLHIMGTRLFEQGKLYVSP